MGVLHFLNVGEGDCSIIQHASDRVTMIDVSCAKSPVVSKSASQMKYALSVALNEATGNFNRKAYPVNPLEYMRDRNISGLFRFVLTHPDMDHLDGIKALFEAHAPSNFWDTENDKSIDDACFGFSQADWDFYERIRDNRFSDLKRLTLYAGSRGEFYNEGNPSDGLYVLAPTPELIERAISEDDYNDASYVILYRSLGGTILFTGDSHDDTWEWLLNSNFRADVTDIDILIAPHHGRKSGRSFEFLNVVNPKLTFFGCAKSQYQGYQAWYTRGLQILTNNQADCLIVNSTKDGMFVYCTYETFARKANPFTFWDGILQGWYLGQIGTLDINEDG